MRAICEGEIGCGDRFIRFDYQPCEPRGFTTWIMSEAGSGDVPEPLFFSEACRTTM